MVFNFRFHFSALSETDAGAESETGAEHSTEAPSAVEKVEPTSSSGSLMKTLGNAGQTLGEAEAELVLSPLRLAFESKNMKMVELALDCLHVGALL